MFQLDPVLKKYISVWVNQITYIRKLTSKCLGQGSLFAQNPKSNIVKCTTKCKFSLNCLTLQPGQQSLRISLCRPRLKEQHLRMSLTKVTRHISSTDKGLLDRTWHSSTPRGWGRMSVPPGARTTTTDDRPLINASSRGQKQGWHIPWKLLRHCHLKMSQPLPSQLLWHWVHHFITSL